jgi:hypothetical protein
LDFCGVTLIIIVAAGRTGLTEDAPVQDKAGPIQMFNRLRTLFFLAVGVGMFRIRIWSNLRVLVSVWFFPTALNGLERERKLRGGEMVVRSKFGGSPLQNFFRN